MFRKAEIEFAARRALGCARTAVPRRRAPVRVPCRPRGSGTSPPADGRLRLPVFVTCRRKEAWGATTPALMRCPRSRADLGGPGARVPLPLLRLRPPPQHHAQREPSSRPTPGSGSPGGESGHQGRVGCPGGRPVALAGQLAGDQSSGWSAGVKAWLCVPPFGTPFHKRGNRCLMISLKTVHQRRNHSMCPRLWIQQ